MWGQICTEASIQTNFNVGFSTYKSDILGHLSQWQYWWWFWFSFFWTFYYFLILRTIKNRITKMNPKLNTSVRGRGKWGDFIVALIPVSWCMNILINSNFILRMIEWQNESSLFTLRVHGKQWYWIYKFDLKNTTDLFTTPKSLGNGRWCIQTPSDLLIADTYLQSTHLRSKINWMEEYWTEISKKKLTNYEAVEISDSLIYKNKNRKTKTIKTNTSILNIIKKKKTNNFFDIFKRGNLEFLFFRKNDFYREQLKVWVNSSRHRNFFEELLSKYFKFDFLKAVRKNRKFKVPLAYRILKINVKNKTTTQLSKYSNNKHYEYIELDNEWDIEHNIKKKTTIGPVRLLKNMYTSNIDKGIDMFKLRITDSNDALETKISTNMDYYVLKQKRYKKKQLIKNTTAYELTTPLKKQISSELPKFYSRRLLTNNKIINNTISSDDYDSYSLYKLIRNNRKRSELLPVTVSRRLLRTKRTLVLPSHTNITVVTNSYDVVHSWFIPGLGLKMDCVPGRSTHHSLYIDNVGFYYGQCAEICGRYHHHMPIRICALPFEHFIVWWNTKGLSRLAGTLNFKDKQKDIVAYKYVW